MFLGFVGRTPRIRGGKLRDPLRGIAPNSQHQMNSFDKKTGSTESGQTHFEDMNFLSLLIGWKRF
ncbi:hypothetical protein [Planktothricoides raciborskii]|uniref:Uncharacterized protein n=1 Tax=Planktothricoides raciborskii GIHE-MW2 TaxID=2792601 RepID=A0AAU8JCP2_9CYAN